MGAARGRAVAAVWLLGAIGLLAGCGSAAMQRFDYRRPVMGVESRVTLYAPDEAAAAAAAEAVFARLADLEDVMSDWRDDSELMRLCARAGETVPVSEDLYRVLRRAQQIAAASDGTFDVTIGPLVRLWRTARREGRVPDANDLERARSLVGPELMILDAGAGTVRLARPGMQLDLGGIGKGFAADEALVTLRRFGVERALVDLGGDVVVSEPPPGRAAWRVAIMAGPDAGDTRPRTIDLVNAAVATSGRTYQSIVVDGVRYSHIVDPRTGLGLTHALTVTVIAPDGATADALASAISVLGAERGRALATRYPGVTIYIEATDDSSG